MTEEPTEVSQPSDLPVSGTAAPRPVSVTELPTSTLLKKAFLVFLCFGLAGFAVAWREVSRLTLLHIVTPDGLGLQEQNPGFPVPKLLDWSQTQLDWMLLARDLEGAGLWLATAGVGFLLLLGTLYALNPTFRLFRTISVIDHETVGRVAKVGLIFLTPALLFCAVTWVMDRGLSPYLWVLRLAVLSLSLWTGFHLDGQAGDLTLPPSKPRKSALSTLVVLSLVSTLLIMMMINSISDREVFVNTLDAFQSLGTFNRLHWAMSAGVYLQSYIIGFGLVGLILMAMAYPARRWFNGLVGVGCLLGLFFIWARLWFTAPKFMAHNYDAPYHIIRRDETLLPYPYDPRYPSTGVPDNDKSVKAFAGNAGISVDEKDADPDRNFILFNGKGDTAIVRQPGYSIDNLVISPEGRKAALDYLAKKNYLTAYSWIAIRYIFNSSVYDFDTSGGIESLLLDLERCPHLAMVENYLRQMLFTCAASPQNLALLDRYADRSRYGYPDRASYRLIGEMYERMGEPQKALTWYGYAEMPNSYLAKVKSEKPMFRKGSVVGTLTLNGKPLPNVKVAVVPARMNGLPIYLQEEVLQALPIMRSARFFSPKFPPFYIPPFSLRYVSAAVSTDAKGAFRIDNLTEGEYQVVVTLPSKVELAPGFDPKLSVKNAPTSFSLNYAAPTHSLGEIAVTVKP